MHLSYGQKGHLFVQLALTICFFQTAILAQEPNDMVLIDLRDQAENQIEISFARLNGSKQLVFRFYEEGDLLWERNLSGHLSGGGQMVTPFRVLVLGPEFTAETGTNPHPRREWLITDTTGSGTPPSGPPNGGNGGSGGDSGGGNLTDTTGSGVPPTGPPDTGGN